MGIGKKGRKEGKMERKEREKGRGIWETRSWELGARSWTLRKAEQGAEQKSIFPGPPLSYAWEGWDLPFSTQGDVLVLCPPKRMSGTRSFVWKRISALPHPHFLLIWVGVWMGMGKERKQELVLGSRHAIIPNPPSPPYPMSHIPKSTHHPTGPRDENKEGLLFATFFTSYTRHLYGMI